MSADVQRCVYVRLHRRIGGGLAEQMQVSDRGMVGIFHWDFSQRVLSYTDKRSQSQEKSLGGTARRSKFAVRF